ncbi:MAG: hypothetical protein K0S16_2287 [Moraxellaceae bacterium]|nr:hypothetical protein [Moraxellaceae bacterium]
MKTRYRLGLAVLAVFAAGFLLPERALIPVQAADRSDWHPRSFWYEPWGRSGVHKGIDIFAREGVSVLAATPGIVIFEEQLPMGGNVVGVLGPRWRVHYYLRRDLAAAAALARQRRNPGLEEDVLPGPVTAAGRRLSTGEPFRQKDKGTAS